MGKETLKTYKTTQYYKMKSWVNVCEMSGEGNLPYN